MSKDLPPVEGRPLQRIREELQRLMGVRGDPLDAAMTVRSAVSAGLVRTTPGGGFEPLPASSEPDLTPPPDVGGLTATAGLSQVVVKFSAPTYTQGHGNLRTIIYAAQKDRDDPTLPVFGDAAIVDALSGTLSITSLPSNLHVRWHIWAKHQSVDGVLSVNAAGGVHGVQATTGVIANTDLGDLILTAEKIAYGGLEGINLIANPDAETGTSGWTADAGTILDEAITPGAGAKSFKLLKGPFTSGEEDLHAADVVFQLQRSGSTFVDQSPAGRALTITGVTVDDAITKFGHGAAYSANRTSNIVVSSNSDIVYSGQFTLEFWIYIESLPSPYSYWMMGNTNTGNSYVALEPTGAILLTSGGTVATPYGSIGVGAWHHVAFCQGSSESRIFVDGVQKAYSASVAWTDSGAPHPFGLFIGINGGNGGLSGRIEDVRFTKVCRYTSGFTPPGSLHVGEYIPGENGAAISDKIRVIPGEAYRVRLMVRGDTAGPLVVEVNEAATDPAGDYVTTAGRASFTDIGPARVTTGWTRLDLRYTAPPGINWVSLSVGTGGDGPNTLLFDEVQFGRAVRAASLEAGTIAVGSAAIAYGAIINAMIGDLTADKITSGYTTSVDLEAGTFAGSEFYIGGAVTYAYEFPDRPTVRSGIASVTGANVALTAAGAMFNVNYFKVWNGSAYETPFEIVEGVVKIKTANIGSLTATNVTINYTDITGTKPPADATKGAPAGTYVGSTLAENVESTLTNKLDKNARNVLAGNGGLAVGTLTWDSSGVRTGGNGLGITGNGIVAYKAGSPTFVIGADGTATFSGALSAASGTFAGALTAATGTLGALTVNDGGSISSGQSAYNTGVGFWLGKVSGVTKFSIGDPSGTHMLFDGTDLTINTAPFSPFTASISGGTLTSVGSRTVTPSGGTAPYTYQWIFQPTAGSGGWQVWISAGVDTATATISGYGDGASCAGRLTAFVIDATGRMTTASVDVSFTFASGGAGP